MIETMHAYYWAKCSRRGCNWEGTLRSSYWAARDDEVNHRVKHIGRRR